MPWETATKSRAAMPAEMPSRVRYAHADLANPSTSDSSSARLSADNAEVKSGAYAFTSNDLPSSSVSVHSRNSAAPDTMSRVYSHVSTHDAERVFPGMSSTSPASQALAAMVATW